MMMLVPGFRCCRPRRSAKKLDAERLPLERETTSLRRGLAEMTGEDEVRAAPAARAHANGYSRCGSSLQRENRACGSRMKVSLACASVEQKKVFSDRVWSHALLLVHSHAPSENFAKTYFHDRSAYGALLIPPLTDPSQDGSCETDRGWAPASSSARYQQA